MAIMHGELEELYRNMHVSIEKAFAKLLPETAAESGLLEITKKHLLDDVDRSFQKAGITKLLVR